MRDDVLEKVDEAIDLMDDAVKRTKDEIARTLKRSKTAETDGYGTVATGSEIINIVSHNFSWALANALTQLKNAHRRNEDALLEQK